MQSVYSFVSYLFLFYVACSHFTTLSSSLRQKLGYVPASDLERIMIIYLHLTILKSKSCPQLYGFKYSYPIVKWGVLVV